MPQLFEISKYLLGQVPLTRILARSCTQRFPFRSLHSSIPKYGGEGRARQVFKSRSCLSHWLPLFLVIGKSRSHVAERPLKLSAVPYPKTAKSKTRADQRFRAAGKSLATGTRVPYPGRTLGYPSRQTKAGRPFAKSFEMLQ